MTAVPCRSDEASAVASNPFALGPRWLAHAANQGMQAAAGCVEAQAIGRSGSHAAVSPPFCSMTCLLRMLMLDHGCMSL